MSLQNYLPNPSEYSAKLVKALESVKGRIYAVGSNARKCLYGLNTPVDGYDFVVSGTADEIISSVQLATLPEAFPGKVSEGAWGVEVDFEVGLARFKIQPIDQFLLGVRFSGDGLAVHCESGRPIVIPEFMTLPPIVTVKSVDQNSEQNNEVWVTKHVVSLNQFQDAMTAEVSKQLDESVKS